MGAHARLTIQSGLMAAVLTGLGGAPQDARASLNCTEDAMIVFDGSGSMSEMGFNLLDEPRIFEARRAMRKTIPSIAYYRRLGLIIYGPGRNDGCDSIDLRFGPVENAAPEIITAVDNLNPGGMTPLTDAVRRAAEVLDFRDRSGAIVLVTDGKETCGGAPCLLGEELAAQGRDLTVHVIGFKVRSDFFSWDSPEQEGYTDGTTVAQCLADRTGGRYVSAETVDELVAALQVTLGCQVIGLSRPTNGEPPSTG